MAGPVVQAEGLRKAYGGLVLFEDAHFRVEVGQKVAIVGPNGAGKSTLLRILAGRERADAGTLHAGEVRTHWFEQHPVIPIGATVRDVLSGERSVPPHLAQEKSSLEARIGDPALYEHPGYEAVLERYAELEREITLATAAPPAGGPVVDALGLGAMGMDAEAARLSGGEKTRLFLARSLMDVRDDDLVVLDEPTNHLDVESIEWLEDWIDAFPGTLLVVAHDRAFLDNVAQRVMEVATGEIRVYEGNYEDYVEAREEERRRRRRDHERARGRVQQAKGTVLQFRHQKRFDGQYASRLKQLKKYQAALERAPDPVLEQLGFGLRFDAVDKSSDEMIRASGVACAFGDKQVLQGVDLELEKGDRVGLVGGNGTGKTTLLRILTGRTAPGGGTVRAAPGVKGLYVAQEHDGLDPGRTLHEEVLDARGTLLEPDVKAILGRFHFSPETDMRRTVATLSGGERQRIAILKSVLKPSNLLVLDEPTNHLDLWGRDVVIDALRSYDGTLLLVSHDRFLLDAVTTKTAVLRDGQLDMYPGSFTESRDLHRKTPRTVQRPTRRYVVRKKFTDWTTRTKHLVHEELQLTDEEVQENRSYKNAISQSWLERA